MNILTIDLGTTFIKVGCFDSELRQLSMESVAVELDYDNEWIEFDPDEYFSGILSAMKNCIRTAGVCEISRIVLTGQAESLVILDKNASPVRKAISWLDNRSSEQVKELSSIFDPKKSFLITGQVEILTTWPVTKILWLKQNEPGSYYKADKYLLLKDYIVFRLTGRIAGEYSIYNFSYYFDIVRKNYWTEILDYIGVKESQLPQLFEPCTDIGTIKEEIADAISTGSSTIVNIGTLDHFAGMIGTGNIRPGIVSESTGTVLSVATMVKEPLKEEPFISCHYGPFVDSYVLLAVSESGGICLEWFRNEFLSGLSYKELNVLLSGMSVDNPIIFLPYVNGTNAPDFDQNGKGVFYGLNIRHNKYDMAFAVMEGVAHLLANNVDFFEKLGVNTETIYSTGGGSRSDVWSQLKADLTGKQVFVPENSETASVGCAIIGLVNSGIYSSYEEVISKFIKITRSFQPQNTAAAKRKHELYDLLLDRMREVFNFRV